jgi:hypothetical protein
VFYIFYLFILILSKVEKESYQEKEKFYEEFSNLFNKYYDVYNRDYNGTLVERFCEKEMREFTFKVIVFLIVTFLLYDSLVVVAVLESEKYEIFR